MEENQAVDPASLSNRQRGHVAELAFMNKAASLGFSVAKPWGEGERYDVIVRVEKACWRVQVKSVLAKVPTRSYYRVRTIAGRLDQRRPLYSAQEIDFLVAYIFPEETWYVFPATLVENRKCLCVVPGSKRSKFEQYREAWKLMRPQTPLPEIVSLSGSFGATSAQPAKPVAAVVASAIIPPAKTGGT